MFERARSLATGVTARPARHRGRDAPAPGARGGQKKLTWIHLLLGLERLRNDLQEHHVGRTRVPAHRDPPLGIGQAALDPDLQRELKSKFTV